MTTSAVKIELPRSRTSDIYDRIRQDIVCGAFLPGCKLKIEVLRERFDAGATPIREALSLLTADGLVERLEQRGFRVAEVSESEFVELLAVRCWLEDRVIRQAVQKGGKEWEEGIVLAHYRLSRTPRVPPDVSQTANFEYEHHHRSFHLSLVAACGSNTLLRLWHKLYNEANRYRYLARLSSFERPSIADEHQQIADAVLARDADRAVQLLVEHYKRTGALLETTIPTSIEPAPEPDLTQNDDDMTIS